MSEITLVKTTDLELTETERAALHKLLFGGYLEGMADEDKKEWRKLWGRLNKLGAGEMANITFKVMRNGKFHRKFFALLNLGYEAWEPQRKHKSYKGIAVAKNFEQFRSDVLIYAGYYEQTFNLDGELKLTARSISFANMSQEEFEQVYSAVADVLLQKVLITYKDRNELDEVIGKVLRFL